MKQAVFALALFLGVSVWSQTALSPPGTVMSPPGSLALSPAEPVAASTPAGTSTASPSTTNVVTDLALSLVQLQVQLEQILPALASFNNSFDFIDAGGVLSGTGTASNASASSASSLALTSTNTSSPSILGGTNLSSTLLPSGTTGLTNTITLTPGFILPIDTNGFTAFPVTRDTLRQLLVLQSDMQRMLPVLSALNTGTGLGFPVGFSTSPVTPVGVSTNQ